MVAEGSEVLILDNFFNPDSIKRKTLVDGKKVKMLEHDVRHPIKLKDVECVYHLAAQISVGNSFKDPGLDADINIRGTINLLDVARDNDCPFVISSSSTVYGNADVPTPETAPLMPISPYGASKRAAESYCSIYASEYNIPITVFRIFNVYGIGGFKGVIPDFIHKLKTDPKQLQILGDGKQTKDYIYIDDVVDAFFRRPKGTFNLGTGVSYSVLDLAKLVISGMGLEDVKVETGHANWPGDVPITQPDITKLLSTGWKPKVGLEEGIQKTVAWHASLGIQ